MTLGNHLADRLGTPCLRRQAKPLNGPQRSLSAESDISREARRNTSGNLYTGKTTREGLR
jgi:hypothetical protein